ncbi:MAG: hypothetical protein K6T65_13985 [Peptococcaceae bacterium]|nr:hypothetical protein [Peptococcaceae bacterium]
MNSRDPLIVKYKHKIIPGEKNVDELIEYLKRKVDIVEISATELVNPILQFITYNVVHCIRNKQLKLTADELNFIAYKLIRNDKSTSYYQNDYVHVGEQEDDIIFVVLETKTGSIYSNSNKLQLELFVEQGVSQYDYDNETLMLVSYLSYLDRYSNEE